LAKVDHPWVAERVTTARLTPAALIYALRDHHTNKELKLIWLLQSAEAKTVWWLDRPSRAIVA